MHTFKTNTNWKMILDKKWKDKVSIHILNLKTGNHYLSSGIFSVCLFLLFLFPYTNSFGYDLTKVNFNFVFDPNSDLQYHYKVAASNNLATIFLRFDFNTQKIENPDEISIQYQVIKGYSEETKPSYDSLNENHLILSENNNRYYKFSVPIVKNETLVVLRLVNPQTNSEYLFDVPVDLPLQFPKSPLLLMEHDRDIPIFSDYISMQETFRIVSIDENVDEVYYFHYNTIFPPADPPMTKRSLPIEKELEVDFDSTIQVNQHFSLPAKGLYFFQSDTTSAKGISVVVTDNHYPQLAKAETLVEPIVYISTSREMKKVRDLENKKKAMDTYWLDLTKSPERSKKIIRDYYRQIELANYLFTTYKEGWKTDRGMIITLYGKPDAVFKNGESEEWIYERRGSMSRLNFTFIKIKNVFSDDHYEMIRNTGFDREWFRIVDQWRKGRQEI